MLNVRGRRAVVVGGGPVAVRRAGALVHCGAAVTVIAPEIDPAMAEKPVDVVRRGYEPADLQGVFVVVIATNDRAVNARVAADARERGVLVNRADEPAAGDFVVPAHRHRGPITVAVSTDGISAAAARELVEQCVAAIDDDWRALLEAVEPLRVEVQRDVADDQRRQELLRRLADDQAMALLRERGAEALRAHLREQISRMKAS